MNELWKKKMNGLDMKSDPQLQLEFNFFNVKNKDHVNTRLKHSLLEMCLHFEISSPLTLNL